MTWSVLKYKRHLCYVIINQNLNDLVLQVDTKQKGNKWFCVTSLTKKKGHNLFGKSHKGKNTTCSFHCWSQWQNRGVLKCFRSGGTDWFGLKRLGFSSLARCLRPPSPSPDPADGHNGHKWTIQEGEVHKSWQLIFYLNSN